MIDLSSLITKEAPQGASFRFGVVTAASPLRVRLDGDPDPLPTSPPALTDLVAGERVLVMIYQRQAIVLGAVRTTTSNRT